MRKDNVPILEMSRRAFLHSSAHGLGLAALGSLLNSGQTSAMASSQHAPSAKRVISLFQSGGPSQMDLFDPKPHLQQERGKELPASIRGNQRITTMTSKQEALPILPSPYQFVKKRSKWHRHERTAAAFGSCGR